MPCPTITADQNIMTVSIQQPADANLTYAWSTRCSQAFQLKCYRPTHCMKPHSNITCSDNVPGHFCFCMQTLADEADGANTLIVTHGDGVNASVTRLIPWALVYPVLHTGFTVAYRDQAEGGACDQPCAACRPLLCPPRDRLCFMLSGAAIFPWYG